MTKSELLIIDLLASIDKKLNRLIDVMISIRDKDKPVKTQKPKPINNNKRVVAEIVKYNDV